MIIKAIRDRGKEEKMISVILIMIAVMVVLSFYLPIMYGGRLLLYSIKADDYNKVVKAIFSIFVYAFMLLATVFSVALLILLIV